MHIIGIRCGNYVAVVKDDSGKVVVREFRSNELSGVKSILLKNNRIILECEDDEIARTILSAHGIYLLILSKATIVDTFITGKTLHVSVGVWFPDEAYEVIALTFDLSDGWVTVADGLELEEEVE